MRKNENKEIIEGRLFTYDLAVKTVQDQNSANFGKEYIAGTVEIAVDEDGLNVIPVHYTYVTATNKKNGTENRTFTVLKKIIESKTDKCWSASGKENAMMLKAEPALDLNEFYKDEELVSAKRNEGGFLSIVNSLNAENERNTFSTDMLITGCTEIEEDEEKQISAHVVLKGAIFNFRNEILPVEFTVRNPEGMKYFIGLDISNQEPVYTKVWGRINCETKTTTYTEESAFGEAAVRTTKRVFKDWTVTGTKADAYEFGEENVLTQEELTTAIQNRQVKLAEIKQKNDEYKAQKNTTSTTAAPTPASGKIKDANWNF